MNLRRAVLSDPDRRRDLASIHIAKKQLGMEDDSYRHMLWSVARVRSAGELDFPGRKAVLAHLKACGFTPKRVGASDPLSRKIRALWLRLKARGALRDPSEKALESYVEHQTSVKKLQWLSSEQAAQVIESLKAWERRVAAAQERSSSP